mmetsp:Transcript_12520/g.26995  ORF Transcript_12520/g.26995 Transcript_12520/m.26995 type:complete len:370 (-) Transcript_12520:488-1597(-)|eukprot:CAMPEP_0202900160 /NCGR_PEP_ID=MMETSP1392-20130828/10165_1 /ASSEMBLY_ACC=CAM_ASM_000868 /TAXON_ID=225041 /ORGANISM="Chlamydomonas chlamydogama, Strain SAG 11-48b" /LENGTH=369 /DNA_ID=CAMNT_0049586495 /DNA_START=86 /DNA_END=1195 /DNA_ORIENTATION=+
MPYWLVSLPLINKRRELTWERLQEKSSGYSENYKFEIPELRVGTLDALMHLSDDLSKTNTLMEVVVSKLRRQVYELNNHVAVTLKVDGLPADGYLARFKWNEAKYQAKRPLRELVDIMTDNIGRIEDDLKVKVAEYNGLKGQLSAVARKAGGSLSVRDIAPLVKPQHVVDSETLTTLFVVVGKFNLKDWESCYEKLTNFVVPRSSKVVVEDNDYALVNVVMFKRVVDDFKTACRSKGFQVREYHAPSEASGDLSAAQIEQLKKDVETKKLALDQWCKTAFSEAFSSWVHMLAIRLYVESILRYGLPPAYQAAVIKPVEKTEAKLREALATSFADGKSHYWKDDGSSAFAGLAGDTELHPYVSFTISMDS